MRLSYLHLLTLATSLAACSLLNRNGPEVTCADLDEGAVNACESGIIATCHGGEMTYVVCDDAGACERTWQVQGAFSCVEGGAPPSTGGGGSGGSSGVGGSNGCTGDGPCVIVSNDLSVSAYTVWDNKLYFSDREKVASVPVTGGFATVLAEGLAGDAEGKIAVDANHVYLLTNADGSDQVVRVPLGGGAIEILATAGSIDGVAIDDDSIFWLDNWANELKVLPKLGGEPVTASTGVFLGDRMIVRDGFLYFAGSQAINRIPAGGPFPVSPASISLGYDPSDFAIGPTDVFFASTVDQLVAKVPLSGGGLVELATEQPTAEVLTIDDSWVYYAPAYAGPPTEIRKVNQKGGSPKAVATTTAPNTSLGRIVVDDTHLYWAEGTAIWRAPK